MFKTTVSCTHGAGVQNGCAAPPARSPRRSADQADHGGKAGAPDQAPTRTFSAELRHLLAHLVTLR